jgi:deazaflavin-dependent oxidoreductase (nitroreductase family)
MSEAESRRQRLVSEYAADPLAVNRKIVEEYRASGGHVAQFGGPERMLLLTTIGAKSGKRRVTPLMYLRDGDRFVVYASHLGAERHPSWYHNLVAHPDVVLEVGRERFPAHAVVTMGEERERLWRMFPFPEHQERTNRQIPVIAIERR